MTSDEIVYETYWSQNLCHPHAHTCAPMSSGDLIWQEVHWACRVSSAISSAPSLPVALLQADRLAAQACCTRHANGGMQQIVAEHQCASHDKSASINWQLHSNTNTEIIRNTPISSNLSLWRLLVQRLAGSWPWTLLNEFVKGWGM